MHVHRQRTNMYCVPHGARGTLSVCVCCVWLVSLHCSDVALPRAAHSGHVPTGRGTVRGASLLNALWCAARSCKCVCGWVDT